MGRAGGARPLAPWARGPRRRRASWLKVVLPVCLFAGVEAAAEDESEVLGRSYDPELPPVVLLPPLTGSVLAVDVDESSVANPLCGLSLVDHVWPPAKSHLALLDCWSEQMKVSIDTPASRATGTEVTDELQGVRVHTVADETGKEALTHGIFERVLWELQLLGYRQGKNVFAAPFDWRRGPGYWAEHSWPRLKSSVEHWVQQGGKPAIFVSLSLGGPYFVAFLLHHPGVDAAWKQRHVAGLVSLSGPFAGTPSALSVLLWGRLWPGMDDKDTAGAGVYHRLLTGEATSVLKPLMEGWGSIAWLLPRTGSTRPAMQPLVQLPPSWGTNVTAEALSSLLPLISESAAELYALGRRFPTEAHPGVKVHCFFGEGVKAPTRFAYLGSGTAEAPSNAKERAKVAARMATDMLRKRGVTEVDGELREKMVGLAGELAELMAPSTTPSDARPVTNVTDGPPGGAYPGSDEWMAAASELLGERVPEKTVSGDGDGLVDLSSLAVCEQWRGQPGLPDAEVTRMPGVRHAQEIHLKKHLTHVQHAVASLAGLSNLTLHEAGVWSGTCAERRSACPKVQDPATCTALAIARQLHPEHDCCQQSAANHECTGKACVTKFIVGIVATNPRADYAVEGWRQGCTNAWFPDSATVQRLAKDARSRYKGFAQAAFAESGSCLSKLPGQGCPQMPAADMDCTSRAITGMLIPTDQCCLAVGRVLDCMGESCFANFVAGEALAGRLVTHGLGRWLRSWRLGCGNPRLPVEAVESRMNQTHVALQRLAPLGAAAAGKLWEDFFGGSSSRHEAPAEERGVDEQGGDAMEGEGSEPAPPSMGSQAPLEEGVGAYQAEDGSLPPGTAAPSPAAARASPRIAAVVALAAPGLVIIVVVAGWAARRRRRVGAREALLTEVPLEEGGFILNAGGAVARGGQQPGEEVYRPLSTPREGPNA